MKLHKTKNVLLNKRNGPSTEETTHRVGENICQLHIRQRLITRIYRKLKKLNSPKISEPIKKWAGELTKLSQKKKFKWPENT
jgi:hypothetical protein